MAIINNVKYLTMPQQVEKNRRDIADINNKIQSGEFADDVMWGTARVYTESGPLYGHRVIDGVLLQNNDRVLVAGMGDENGVYLARSTQWILYAKIEFKQVISIKKRTVRKE